MSKKKQFSPHEVDHPIKFLPHKIDDLPEPTYGSRIKQPIEFTDHETGKQVGNLDTVKFFRPDTMDLLTAHRQRLARLPKGVVDRLEATWKAKSGEQVFEIRSVADGKGKFTYFGPTTVEDEDRFIHYLRQQLADIDDELVKQQYSHAPAHVVALEQQLLAYRANSAVQHMWPNASGALQQATVDTLKVAKTYCWAPTCIDAVVLRADRLPDEAMPGELPLGEIVEPGATGWWWFEKPVPLQSTSSGESVVALLWRREVNDQYSRTWFNAFIQETVTLNGRETLVPSPTLAWSWRDERSIAELHETCRTRFDELAKQHRIGYSAATAEESAKGAVWLSKFWMAGGLWLDSRVAGGKRRPSMLATVTTPLPRQQGRQLARQFKLDAPPTVEVVYLRRTEPRSDPSGPGRTVDHQFCWFVEAFPRRQWFPSLGKHQLIMVNEHIRGPRDRPLKHAKRVYAVNR